jgi:kynurenine formamidase
MIGRRSTHEACQPDTNAQEFSTMRRPPAPCTLVLGFLCHGYPGGWPRVEPYPGLPAPRIGEYLDRATSRERYASGTEFSIGRIELVANTGTYLDAPFHRYEEGHDLSELPLETLADLPGIVVRAPRGVRMLGPELFEGKELDGRAVLDTGWARHFGTPAYGSGHPFLTRGGRAPGRARGRAGLIDSLNIDYTSTGERPVHSLLLERDVRIVEHLVHLERLPETAFRFFAVPVKVRGMGSFPVRAFAPLEE